MRERWTKCMGRKRWMNLPDRHQKKRAGVLIDTGSYGGRMEYFIVACDTDGAPRLSSAARIFGHIAFDIESCHFGHTVGAHRNGLLEMTRHTSLSLVGNLDFTFLSRHDGLLGVVGHRTATAWHHLIDDQRLFSGIGENECILLRGIFLGERAEVVAYLVELDAGSLLCFHDLKTQYRQECYQ